MKTIHDIIPDPDVLLKLDLKDLAYVVLEFLNSLDESTQSQILHTHNFSVDPRPVEGYPRAREKEIKLALMEGWAWLERNGLIGPRPNSYGGDWKVITREGRKICDGLGVQSYSHVNLLPKNMLHPVILQAVESDFNNHKFDKAVFQAFKEVEIAVREAGNYLPTDTGVALMRKAFDVRTGPLKDPDLPEAERDALSHLFAGGIGLYKNPGSHRHVKIDPTEAVEMVILASHLFKIVKTRHDAIIAKNS